MSYRRVSGCLLQPCIHPNHTAHLYHRTEDCHCSRVSSLWSVLLVAGLRSHIPTLLGPHPGSAIKRCAINMLDSWFMTLGKTQTGPTLGFLPSKFFHKFPCHFHCRELLKCCFTLSITWTPSPNPHPSFQGPLPSGFCYQRQFILQPLPIELIQKDYFWKSNLRLWLIPPFPEMLCFFVLFFVLNSTFFCIYCASFLLFFNFSNSPLLLPTLVNLFGEPYL